MSEKVEVLIEYEHPEHGESTALLSRGESWEPSTFDATVSRVEVREGDGKHTLAADGSGYARGGMTVEDAAEPDETVEDRLRAAGDCEAMLAMLRGAISPENMTYEDYARPMKLTGGKVALKVYGHGYETAWFYRHADGMIGMNLDGDPFCKGQAAITSLRDDVYTNHRVIEPVRVEDTPFGGEDDE